MFTGDLLVRLYYAKRQIVLSHLDGGVSSRMEISFNDITGVELIYEPDSCRGLFAMEVRQPPRFVFESDPQPKMQSVWKNCADFTGGQATLCSRVCVLCNSSHLKKHVEKIAQSDSKISVRKYSALGLGLAEGAISSVPLDAGKPAAPPSESAASQPSTSLPMPSGQVQQFQQQLIEQLLLLQQLQIERQALLMQQPQLEQAALRAHVLNSTGAGCSSAGLYSPPQQHPTPNLFRSSPALPSRVISSTSPQHLPTRSAGLPTVLPPAHMQPNAHLHRQLNQSPLQAVADLMPSSHRSSSPRHLLANLDAAARNNSPTLQIRRMSGPAPPTPSSSLARTSTALSNLSIATAVPQPTTIGCCGVGVDLGIPVTAVGVGPSPSPFVAQASSVHPLASFADANNMNSSIQASLSGLETTPQAGLGFGFDGLSSVDPFSHQMQLWRYQQQQRRLSQPQQQPLPEAQQIALDPQAVLLSLSQPSPSFSLFTST